MMAVPFEEADGTAEGPRTVELYVRSLAPRGSREHQERTVERLERLESRGAIESFSLTVWGSRIDPGSATARTDVGQLVLRRASEITAWADRNGVSTGSFFEVEPVKSTITDEVTNTMTLPAVTMAEFVDGEFVFATPCSPDGTTLSIEDRLDAYEHAEGVALEGATS